jgi:hypothetical protein
VAIAGRYVEFTPGVRIMHVFGTPSLPMNSTVHRATSAWNGRLTLLTILVILTSLALFREVRAQPPGVFSEDRFVALPDADWRRVSFSRQQDPARIAGDLREEIAHLERAINATFEKHPAGQSLRQAARSLRVQAERLHRDARNPDVIWQARRQAEQIQDDLSQLAVLANRWPLEQTVWEHRVSRESAATVFHAPANGYQWGASTVSLTPARAEAPQLVRSLSNRIVAAQQLATELEVTLRQNGMQEFRESWRRW